MQLSPRTKCLLCLIPLAVLILTFLQVVFSSANCPKPMFFFLLAFVWQAAVSFR